ncbi:TIGR02679 family protein [Antrihabitans spumae]|jgi:uncharacterized protein (TIGR02679 family)|uniref:TIGR02679 family protein n=1 Tax=Antrihabitans spumae TaxID=3373370 RepID=A0ABW7JY74_9NOCA
MRYDTSWLGLEADALTSLDLLLDRARKQVVRSDGELVGSVSVRAADAPGLWRVANGIDRGTRTSLTGRIELRVVALDEWLRRHAKGGGRGLVEILESVTPLAFPKRVAAERDGKRFAVVDSAADAFGGSPPAWLGEWLTYVATERAVYTDPDAVVNAAKVLAFLPVDDVVLTVLAELATGDTKALTKRATTRLVLRGLAFEYDVDAPTSSADERSLWSRAGVVVDSLSSRVLIRGLRFRLDSPVAKWANEAAELGEPCVLTLDQLLRHRLTPTDAPIYVCENPAVLESAARRLGPTSQALVCTEGQPSVAATTLVSRAGGSIRWRGDFDWTGLRTTGAAIARFGATPWLMDIETYSAALERGESEPLKERDHRAESPWEPTLASEMALRGRAVMEERLVERLLADLA